MIRSCIGIDVGLASAAAAHYGYANGSRLPALLDTFRIPTIGEDGARRIDVRALGEWLIRTGADTAYVENATAMPDPNPDPKTGKRRKMGAASMARYLRACGAIECAVTLSGLHGVLVMPAVWQRAVGLTAMRRSCVTDSAKKNCSVILARQVFPERAATTFKFLKSHNEADASLLSVYAASRLDLVSLRVDGR